MGCIGWEWRGFRVNWYRIGGGDKREDMFLSVCIDELVGNGFDFPSPLVEDISQVILKCFKGGNAVMPGLIPDEVIVDALVVNMMSCAINFDRQGMGGEAVMEDIRQLII